MTERRRTSASTLAGRAAGLWVAGWAVIAAAQPGGVAAAPGGPDEVAAIWPGAAPGERTESTGETLPRRAGEDPPATRITRITSPRLHLYKARSTAAAPAVLIFPGGGYNYVVADKEGSEAARWLNGLGITAVVLHYRTRAEGGERAGGELPPHSLAPLQDGQRAIRWLRSQAASWNIDPAKIGVLGFSAGGQAAALVATRHATPAYQPVDAIDQLSCRPDFALLIYPWRLDEGERLTSAVTVDNTTPPTFLVHADDDRASSLSSVYFYAALKRAGVSGELHVYRSGGHGYGMRATPGSQAESWPQRAADWLRETRLAK